MSDDPTLVRSLAVTREDVVRALELRERGGQRRVLRVTPPFAGRMRARLHVEGTEGDYGDPAPLHVDPTRLVRHPPPFPSVDAAEDHLRERGAYSVEGQCTRHARAADRWRRTVGARTVDEADVATPAGPHRVAVAVLG